MSDELTQLDELIESDVLEALGEAVPQVKIDDADGEITDIPDDLAEMLSTSEVLAEENENIDNKSNDDSLATTQEMESVIDEKKNELSNTNISNINTTDLASLLSQLLNNKTIEITIKIKD